jgi:hypothetical protein
VFSFNGADGHHGSRWCHSRGEKEMEREREEMKWIRVWKRRSRWFYSSEEGGQPSISDERL